MTFAGWLLFAVTAALALAVVAWVYGRREAPGRGRPILIALRFLTLALLLLLLFDPRLPAPGGPASHRRMVLVDGSLSMLLPADPVAPRAGTRWQQAVSAARAAAGRTPALVFGAAPRPLPADSLGQRPPADPESRLLPALLAASEAGVGRVLVITDGAIDDAADVARWLPRLGLDVEVRRTARAPAPDFAIADVSAGAWAQAGKPFPIEAAVATQGRPGDSVTVIVRAAGRAIAQRRVPAPPPGRTQPALLTITPAAPAGGGLVRYDVAVVARDAVPDDDERSLYVYVSEQPAGVAIVSFHPDWEPRFLQPVLEDALGLPTRGYLMVAPGRYVTTGSAQEAGRAVTDADVRQALGQAEVIVLHAVGPDAPAWALASARTAARVLLFAAGPAADLGLPFAVPPAVPGEWYVSGAIPASPVAPLLTGIDVTDVPPLYAVRPASVAGGTWAPLLATHGRNGAPSPLALAGESGPRRWVIALGDGYWQWAFRGGSARDIYRRLWASVGGWLIQEQRPLAAAAVRPVERVVPRGDAVRWTAPGLAPDSVAVRVLGEAGATVTDTVLPVTHGDTATMRVLPPGQYRYVARAFAAGKATAPAVGPFTVERFSSDFLRPLLSPAQIAGAGTALAAGGIHRSRGVPLHTTPWPYIVIVLALLAEWVLRRRWGLR